MVNPKSHVSLQNRFKDLYVHCENGNDVNPEKYMKINITTREPTLASQRRPSVVINNHSEN